MILAFVFGCAEEPTEPIGPTADEPVVAEACLPEGEVGLEVGDTVEDLAFEDCDGEPYSLHDGCGRPLFVQNLYAWCGPCLDHLDLSAELQGEHPELGAVVVLTEDVLGNPPDRAFCRELRETYDVAGTVVVDPDRQLEATYGGPGLVLVLDREGVVTFSRIDATEDAIVEAVASVVD